MKKTVIAVLASALAAVTLCACAGIKPAPGARLELGDSFDPKLFEFAGRRRPNVSAVPEQPVVPEPPVVPEELPVMPEETSMPLVVTAYEYTRPVTPYYEGIIYTGPDHHLAYPAISTGTPSANAFNEKIAAEYTDAINELAANIEGPNIYVYYYEYTEQSGIVGIALMRNFGMQASEFYSGCSMYYFDTVADRELTFAEYLDALHIDYDSMFYALGDCGVTFTDIDGQPASLAPAYDRYPLLVGALFDSTKTYVIYQGENQLGVYTTCAEGQPILARIQTQ